MQDASDPVVLRWSRGERIVETDPTEPLQDSLVHFPSLAHRCTMFRSKAGHFQEKLSMLTLVQAEFRTQPAAEFPTQPAVP